jgi:hypothetical protein
MTALNDSINENCLKNGDFPLIKAGQTCAVGWITIVKETQSWKDIALLFGEILNL